MQRVNKRYAETIADNGSAGIAHAELFQTFATQPAGDFWICDNRRTGFFGNLNGIADMVTMTMSQRNMRGSLGGFLEIDALGTRISIDERINQNDGLIRFNAIGCMAQPVIFIVCLLAARFSVLKQILRLNSIRQYEA